MDKQLEQQVKDLEQRVAELEEQVQAQPQENQNIKYGLFCILNTASFLINKALTMTISYDELFTSKPVNKTASKSDSNI